MIYRFVFSLLFLPLVTVAGLAQQSADQPVSFTQDIRPILSDRCFACHGPDANSREADLRLDEQEAAHDYAIVPGSLEDSEVWNRLTTHDESMIMPPPSSHKKPLDKDELDLIKRWIEQGAEYEQFWAFVKPKKQPLPEVENQRWAENFIDRLVFSKLRQWGLQPASPTDGRTLARRVALDLTGLPPSPEMIDKFLEQRKQLGHDQAYQQYVDRLLESPQYGEHMARYWLDAVRYADTNGMHKDFYRNHFAYRDWVIRAFNDNLPYDQFAKDQLAGDLYEEPTKDQLTATAFHRLHLIIDRGTALPEESFHKNVIDRVTSFGTAFMGMTLHCAQCHDHKYDPISAKEFYSLYAFFDNIDAAPETVAFPKNGLQPPFISLADEAQQNKLNEFDEQLRTAQSKIQQLEQQIKDNAQAQAADDVSPEQAQSLIEELKALQSQLKQMQEKKKRTQRERDAFDRSVPYAMVMRERNEVRATHILQRGQYDSPGEQVTRGTPSFLPPLVQTGENASRLDLANWLVSPEHPLTARVAVNRFWQQLFGVGLVKTAEDFGAQGEVPRHRQLLDHLAVEFVESGWDVKALMKQIVMSQTYQQASEASPEQIKSDPENRMLARGSRFRLDAEVIRDQILKTSGLLSDKMYGPSVKPPQPDGLWKAVTMINERFRPDSGDAIYRRSVYTYWKRGMPPPQMTILNAPTRDACIARRERTNTPSQALLLLNEPEYMKAARALARRAIELPEDQRIDFAWQQVTCQVPDQQEQSTLQELLQDAGQHYQQQPELAEQACAGIEGLDADAKQQLAAWTVVINTLYNLDITKSRN